MKHYFSIPSFFLFGILILAVVLRIWSIGSVPPSASMDEASISYNAYSLLKTGGDEYGEIPLLSHRSYDDWRRATYLYLVVPFVAVLDLNVYAVRFPSIILSVLTVLSTYYIVTFLFPKKSIFSETTALLASFLLAISPWHIYISRIGHETNAYMSFFVFGILFFLIGEKKKKWLYIFIGLVFFALSMASYYAGQAIVPVFLLGIIVVYWKSLYAMIKTNKKIIFLLFGAFVCFLILGMELFAPDSLVRFQATSTFSKEAHGDLYAQRVLARNKAVEDKDYLGMVWYNQRLYPIQVFVDGYIAHINPQWLFSNPDSQPHKVPNMGLLYVWQLPFLLVGIISFLFSKLINWKTKLLVLLWIVLSPLPGAIATQAPHAMRSYTFVVVLQIITAYGLTYVFFRLKQLRIFLLVMFAIVIVWSLWIFYVNYFIVFPKEQSKSFEYAFSKMVPYVLSVQNNYKKIIFSNTDNLYQSYMVFLFHSKYDPFLYQGQGGTISGGYAEPHQFGKYEFRDVNLTKEKLKKGNLYIVNYSQAINALPIVKTFKNLDEKTGVVLISL